MRWTKRRRLKDPIEEHTSFSDTESKIAVAGHPIHAMMVAFPIAMCFATLGADGMYWLTGDSFWPRVAVWAAGIAFFIGVLAGIAGTIELLLVPGIRIRSASWTHFILAVMLLSVLGLNWGFRLDDPVGAVLPWGGLLSMLAALMTGITGWHGGKLVFDYQIGTHRLD
ncbi:DUF2231 domain-containing protein [Paracoccus sp. (in: a-proteobacteria)]|uniref:DUF2231 domain-containing protein n=1 Tax=Paracoccus sp. TaxID=267 RepID=UPI0026E07CBF|nr:DUF2231 domain-containing protein [Paracoccus sp. (in: a-proteobacteria)]MDO5646651.1 DUF2231 domain-containing protein [Paracoccus sp. (in: a-proteobacteria)]